MTRSSRVSVGVGLLITVALVILRVEYVRHAGGLWRDEVNSVNVATLPTFADVFWSSHLDSFPATWVIVLHGWTVAGLGETDQDLRRLGLLIGVATIAVMWWTGRRLGLDAPLVTLLLFGMSPTAIIYGDEVRGYGLGVLGVCWCIGAFWCFVAQPTWRAFLAAQLAAIFAVQAYYGNCFLLLAICAGAAAVCLRRRHWRALTATLVLGAVAGASVLVNIHSILYAARLSPIEQGDYSLIWLADVFRQALAPEAPTLAIGWIVGPLLAVVGCGLAWRSSPANANQDDNDRAWFAVTTSAGALVSYCGYLKYISVRTQFWYYLPLMALIALSCDVGTDLLARRVVGGQWVRIAAIALAALLAVNGVAGAVAVRMTNLDLIARKLEEEARPADLVVVLPWYCGITFQRYYRGPAPWITLPDFEEHKFHLHRLVVEKMKLGDAGIAPELGRVERTLRESGRVWIVGAPLIPSPDAPPLYLPPWPTGADGWQVGPYLEGWRLQLGAVLQTHGREFWKVPVPDMGRVNLHEDLPLQLVEGWR